MKKRIHQIELFVKYPIEVQKELLLSLVSKAKGTEIGKRYDFKSIRTYQEYSQRVPIQNYEQLYPLIERHLKGEKNVLWPTDIRCFAKSSGTTNAKSKFIPVSNEALEDCHFKAGKDMLSLYVNNFNPNSKLFKGTSISLGGTLQVNPWNPDTVFGDVSAVIMQNLPVWAQIVRAPKLKTALLEDWETKIERIAKETIDENITGFAGVPTWTVVLIKKVLEITGANHIQEVWPNLELFIHGAVSFVPYRSLFQELIPNPIHYQESYTASEGFFGIQDQPDRNDMLLMLDYGIFYEFIPIESLQDQHRQAIGLESVVLDKTYAMVITTNAGLWRYLIGDTIQFTSLEPFRLKIVGRTKHFINAFGEELMVDNADQALQKACDKTHAILSDYTAAPVYFSEGGDGAHEWVIEFEQEPEDFNVFIDTLDATLQEVNSDYAAKRFKDMALKKPIVHKAEKGVFYQWLQEKGKLGGQHKVPRLSNHREYLEGVLKICLQDRK